MATVAEERQAIGQRIVGGAIGGLAGGMVFGMLMAMMGMLAVVAGLVGSQSAAVGFVIHLAISTLLGLGFAVTVGALATSYRTGAVWGLAYGAIWWVLGPLVLMPLMMGMGLQFGAALTPMMLQSLMGHLLYGLVAGLVYAWYPTR